MILSRYQFIFGLRFHDILKTIDFLQVNEYEELRKVWVGYAEVYLWRCNMESKEDIANIELYTKLVEFDTRLGTTVSEQLFRCIFHSLRLDLIKV